MKRGGVSGDKNSYCLLNADVPSALYELAYSDRNPKLWEVMGHAAWSWKPISCSSQDPCSGPGGEGGWCEGGLAWLENGISRAGAQSRA